MKLRKPEEALARNSPHRRASRRKNADQDFLIGVAISSVSKVYFEGSLIMSSSLAEGVSSGMPRSMSGAVPKSASPNPS